MKQFYCSNILLVSLFAVLVASFSYVGWNVFAQQNSLIPLPGQGSRGGTGDFLSQEDLWAVSSEDTLQNTSGAVVDLGDVRGINVSEPVNDGDGMNKAYFDTEIQGMSDRLDVLEERFADLLEQQAIAEANGPIITSINNLNPTTNPVVVSCPGCYIQIRGDRLLTTSEIRVGAISLPPAYKSNTLVTVPIPAAAVSPATVSVTNAFATTTAVQTVSF